MLDTGRSERPTADGSPDEPVVLAFACTDPMHEVVHFSAETHDTLLAKVLSHFAEYHPEITDSAVREILAAATYVETDDVSAPGNPETRPSYRTS